jgi:hypothetical protein
VCVQDVPSSTRWASALVGCALTHDPRSPRCQRSSEIASTRPAVTFPSEPPWYRACALVSGIVPQRQRLMACLRGAFTSQPAARERGHLFIRWPCTPARAVPSHAGGRPRYGPGLGKLVPLPPTDAKVHAAGQDL